MTKAFVDGCELSALCGSELGAGDVLDATEKQDCPDASDLSEHEH